MGVDVVPGWMVDEQTPENIICSLSENKGRWTKGWTNGHHMGHVWHIGRVDAFRPKGYGFDSRSSHHLGTLGKSFARNCL